MSRKKELDTIASFIGNAAAHAALLPEDKFAQKEVGTYSSEAMDIFIAKHWNDEELKYLKSKALAKAKSEIRSRIPKYGFSEKDFGKFVDIARSFIDRFISQAKN